MHFYFQNFDSSVLPKQPLFPFKSTMDEYWEHGEIDEEKDSKEELKKLIDITEPDGIPPVGLMMDDHG